MDYMVEMAIEREAQILDTQLECDDLFDLPPFPFTTAKTRINASRNFSSRGRSNRRAQTGTTASRPQYAN